MTPYELQNIITELETKVDKRKATFGIYNAGDSEESFIRANEEGLKSFALELLQAAYKCNDILNDKEKSLIQTNFEESWIDARSDTLIQYIEPVTERLTLKQEQQTETFFERLLPYGCLAVLLILVAAALLGLWTFGKWIF